MIARLAGGIEEPPRRRFEGPMQRTAHSYPDRQG